MFGKQFTDGEIARLAQQRSTMGRLTCPSCGEFTVEETPLGNIGAGASGFIYKCSGCGREGRTRQY